MSASPEFIDFVISLLEPTAALKGDKFFGGIGINSESTQFAMIMGNVLYFLVNDETRPKYEKLKKQPFSYMTKLGKRLVKRYYAVPEDLLENQAELMKWAQESITIAKATQNKN